MASPQAGEAATSPRGDGEAAGAAGLAVPALVNDGHFTAMPAGGCRKPPCRALA
jgi:hypothetical protein